MVTVDIDGSEAIFLYESLICGCYVYKSIWMSTPAEILSANTDPAKRHNHFAIAVLKAGPIAGQLPQKVNRMFHFFLMNGGKIMHEVICRRKFGKGLEVPRVHKFTGTEMNIIKIKKHF